MNHLWDKKVYVGTFRRKFDNTVFLFEISTPEFVKIQNFLQKEKSKNVAPKMPLLGISRRTFEKKTI